MTESNGSSIPLIDLKPFLVGEKDKESVVRAVTKACKEIGFFAITNHGVEPTVMSDVWSASASFFDLSESEKKLASSTDTADYPYGYEQSENLELAKTGSKSQVDLKETFSIGPSHPDSGMPPRRIPSKPVGFEGAITSYYQSMEKLAIMLLQIMALGLDLPENWFIDKMDHHCSALRLLNYPNLEIPVQPGQLRAGAHTDYGALTILKSGGPGLQVKRDQTSDSWVNVPTFDSNNVFIINLGDMMQRWTNGKTSCGMSWQI
jgi:isopenicillin N synthase-like dioxygenase